MRRHTVMDSPLGELTLVMQDGMLVAVRMPIAGRDVDPAADGPADPDALAPAVTQLKEYFAGRRRVFDLPLSLCGTAFQQRVWRGLLELPYGRTCSYGQLTALIGLGPKAVRAVGAANGQNPLAVVVPCHRVIGADGRLVGYAGGLDRKRLLLELEQALPAQTAPLF